MILQVNILDPWSQTPNGFSSVVLSALLQIGCFVDKPKIGTTDSTQAGFDLIDGLEKTLDVTLMNQAYLSFFSLIGSLLSSL